MIEEPLERHARGLLGSALFMNPLNPRSEPIGSDLARFPVCSCVVTLWAPLLELSHGRMPISYDKKISVGGLKV